MAVIFWWLLPLIITMLVGVTWLHIRRTKARGTGRAQRPLAHTARYAGHALYQTYLKKYRVMLRATFLLFAVALFAVSMTIARFASVDTVQPELHNRDIMLCLDVSGSMTETDGALIKVFADLVDGFKGERIGLTVFDSSPAAIFPLTDDYPFVKTQLTSIAKAMNAGADSFGQMYQSGIFEGTGEGEGSSLIGDGLAACTLHFDNLDMKRSRSVILATDNQVNGSQIISLPQAGVVAKDKNIRVYGINPYDYSSSYYNSPESQEYKKVVLATGGSYYAIDDSAKVAGIVDQIKKQDATRFKGAPQRVMIDQPLVWVCILFSALLAYYWLVWRLRL